MTATIASTPRGVPIAAWMVKGNPAVFDVGTSIAEMGPDDSWRWSLANTYRNGLMDSGHLCFLWVTQNDNPDLVSGIWVVCEVTGPAYAAAGSTSLLWKDAEKQKERKAYVPLKANSLLRPITRAELLAHPVLRDLEVLKAQQMGNPQIITPEQLEALKSDFDLTTGELDAELRDRLASWYPSLWVLTASGGGVEVYEPGDDSGELLLEDESSESFDSWQGAYRAAAAYAAETPPQPESPARQLVLAESHTAAGKLEIISSGGDQLSVIETTPDDEVEWADTFDGVAEAMEAIIRYHESIE